jgi:hypothetical protein
MTECSFLFLGIVAVHIGMMHTTFKEWLARRDEGFILPDRPPLKGMPKINTTPLTDAQRKWIQPKPVKKAKPFSRTIRKMKEFVPQKYLAKLGD